MKKEKKATTATEWKSARERKGNGRDIEDKT